MRFVVIVGTYVYGVFADTQSAELWAESNITDGTKWEVVQFIPV